MKDCGMHFVRIDGGIAINNDIPYKFGEDFNCSRCGETGIGVQSPVSKVLFLVQCDFHHWHVCAVCSIMGKTGKLGPEKEKIKRHLLTDKHKKSLQMVLSQVSQDSSERVGAKKRATDHQREISENMELYFPNNHSGDPFFRHQFETGEAGVEMLVGQANFHRCLGAGNVLDPYEVETDFLGACKYWELTQSQRARFVKHDKRIYQLGRIHERQEMIGGGTVKRITPPMDYNSMRKRYFRSENAIVPNLPVPIVRTHIPNHACLDPLDCIRNQLAHGIPMEGIMMNKGPLPSSSAAYDWITETPRAEELRVLGAGVLNRMTIEGDQVCRKVLLLPQLIWQDDFDPNNSVKNNRGSTWAKTCTTAPPRNNRNSPLQTFCIAMGKSKDNSHGPVQSYLAEKFVALAETPSLLYSKIEGEAVLVLPFIYAFLMDQPERRKDLMTAPGGTNYHARFNYSCHAAKLVPVLRTCKDCTLSLRDGILPHRCLVCVSWDVATGLDTGAPEEIVQRLKIPIPDAYPRHHLANAKGIAYKTNDECLLPFAMSIDRLRCSFDLAYTNILAKNWSNKEASAFLERECIAKELATEIIGNATNARTMEDIVTQTTGIGSHAKKLILEDFKLQPERYKQPPKPTSWNVEGGLSVYIDVLMHLLFLGIVKSTLKTLRLWMCKQGKHTEFHRHTEKFNSRLRLLHLDWLKCEEFRASGKYGGWVSENFLAFSRLLNWFFQNIPDLGDEASDGIEPPLDKPFSRWNKPHLVHWLRVRGLKSTGMSVPELKNSILPLIDNPPPIKQSVAGEFIPLQVQRMLVALEEMISVIMVSKVIPGTTVTDMELKIKLFLTEFDLLDQQVKTPDLKPKVITSFNFLCLNNLPKLTERFGPLRNMWEGGHKGEGFIPQCKVFLHQGQKQNFEQHAMRNILRDMSMKSLSEGLSGVIPDSQARANKGTTWSQHLKSLRRAFQIYPTRSALRDAVCTRNIVSVVICCVDSRSSLFGVVQGANKSELNMVGIDVLSDGGLVEKMGCKYQQWIVGGEVLTHQHLAALSILPFSCDVSFGVLLPLFDCGPSPKHTLVRSKRYEVSS